MTKKLFLTMYNLIIIPFAITLLLVFYWPFHSKIQKSMRLRRQSTRLKATSIAPIWIHASSGEFEYAKPVIARLKAAHPTIPVLVTYSSPSYADTISKFNGVELSLPSPLDTPGAIRSFLKKYKPRVLLIARTDLWPQLLDITHQFKIPSLLFSCTFRPMKGARRLLSFYYKMVFNDLSEIYAVSEFDRQNIMAVGTKTPVHVMGDTRFDQVLTRIQNPKPVQEQLFASIDHPVLIAGSTWPEDEKELFSAIGVMLKQSQMKLILAPHEPTPARIDQIQSQLEQKNISSSLYSNAKAWDTSVLILDQVGVLADIYRFGDFAFIGGSFRSKVHSVMEPLAAGLMTIVGPFHTNNREAMTFQQIQIDQYKPVIAVQNEEEFRETVQHLILMDKKDFLRQQIRREVDLRTGATRYVLSWLESHIRIEKTV